MKGTPLPPIGPLHTWADTELAYLRRIRRIAEAYFINPEPYKLEGLQQVLGEMYAAEQTFRRQAG